MKSIRGWVLAVIGCFLFGADTYLAQAQMPPGARPAAADKKLSIVRMPKLNKVKQHTPQYSTSASRTSPGRPREWAVFEITYDTIPEWMDEVVVTYYLMAERRGTEPKKEYAFYQTTVRYSNVARGEHTACVVLPPAAIQRYGDQFLGLAVEFTSADGTLLATQHESPSTLLPANWWKKTEVTDSKNVVKREGLVDRSKTPFALINMDDYEVVQ